MIFNRDFLRNFFVCALIFSYHSFVDDAYAGISGAVFVDPTAVGISGVTSTDIQGQAQKTRFAAPDSTSATSIKLCPNNQYVAACGNYRVGFNWLKSANVPDPNPDSDSTNTPDSDSTDDPDSPQDQNTFEIPYKETKNYYISDDIVDLYKQMRIFFSAKIESGVQKPTIEYLDNGTIQVTDDFQSDREAILNNLCHPSSTDIICMACPNGAKVDASTVQLDADNLTIQNSWEFHTFADCYMQEFEDTTGFYFYVPDDFYAFDSATLSDNAKKCYYQNTNASAIDTLAGDEIGTFVTGLYKNQRVTADELNIPTVKVKKY